ncbi:unnamed protein product [Caenorhabditis bovis]|uniref:CUE domain-containing protein n=1 Tax=Caenorhabditis bovis TaxID=2654633 RepID=A0A8S1ESP4_9PELO|nr:unnamed protein product [Caenorhabditis bovis]
MSGANEILLNFDTAMCDFRHMFPNIDENVIEGALRKHNGDVSATINELLFENKNDASPTQIAVETPQDLRKRKQEIRKKLENVQKLLDTVTNVEMARSYEDQQLAYLLQYEEVKKLIKTETRRNHEPRQISSHYVERCPDGPYVNYAYNKGEI